MIFDLYSLHDEGRHIIHLYQVVFVPVYKYIHFIQMWLCFADFTATQGKVFNGLNESLIVLISNVGIEDIIQFLLMAYHTQGN